MIKKKKLMKNLAELVEDYSLVHFVPLHIEVKSTHTQILKQHIILAFI